MVLMAMPARALARLSEEELLDMYYRDRDPIARGELVKRFLPFARKLARRYVQRREPLDDLVQVACIGLLNAIDRFDPEHGKTFKAFAAPTILGELKRHFRDKGWTIHIPRELQERALMVSREAERLSIELGRLPTLVELADALNCSFEQAVEAVHAMQNYRPTSLDTLVCDGDEDRCPLGEQLGRVDVGFELADDRQTLARSWAELPELEREVLGLRLVEGLTQREISCKIGYSQMHVCRLLRKSLRSLDAAQAAATCG